MRCATWKRCRSKGYSFRIPPEQNSLELTVKVISMRYSSGCPFEELPLELQKTKTLFGYQTLIQYAEEEMEKKDAELGAGISVVISRCIQETYFQIF